MFCKVCNYALWNLKERTCPECGTAFAPSRSRFKPNAVQFLCPHCGQQYYGTSRTGHLVPPRFACVKCAHEIQMDEMVLIPAAGIDERKTRDRGNPWTERFGRPKLRDWFRTTLLSMFTPAALITATDRQLPKRRTLSYAALTAGIGSAASIVMPFMVLMPLLAPLGVNATGIAALGLYVVGVMVSGFMMFLVVPVYAVIAHAILRGGKPHGTLRDTIHAAALSSGANVLWGVPFMGLMTGFAGLIWWGVSMSLMLRAVHRVRGVRAYVAGLGPPLAVVGVATAGFIALIVWSMWMASQVASSSSAMMATQVTAAEVALVEAERSGERHLGSLMLEGVVQPTVALGTPFTQTTAVFAGGSDLTQLLATGTDEERAAMAAALDASLTPDVIAYRIGDLIVIRDVPLDPPVPGLWRAAYSLEPGANAMWYTNPATVGASSSASGGVFIPGAQFGGPTNRSLNPSVTEQNRIRLKHGLPPLPSLETITAAAPFSMTDEERAAFDAQRAATPPEPSDDAAEPAPKPDSGGG